MPGPRRGHTRDGRLSTFVFDALAFQATHRPPQRTMTDEDAERFRSDFVNEYWQQQ